MKPYVKWLLWMSSIATALTGVVYFWMDRMLLPVDEFAIINHPLQPLVLKAHILVAPLLVFAIGVIAIDHIWKYFRGTIRRARRTGVSTMWPIAPMVLSGYLIQAITQEAWLVAIAWVHIGTGLLYVATLVGHQVAVRRSRLVTLQMRVRPDLEEVEPPSPATLSDPTVERAVVQAARTSAERPQRKRVPS